MNCQAAVRLSLWLVCANAVVFGLPTASAGPLTVHASNPRYFADSSGEPVYLTGSHTWSNLQEEWAAYFPVYFDFDGYLDFLEAYNHNFIRLWYREMPRYLYAGDPGYRYSGPFPWARIGPGLAEDGQPRFNLSQFDPAFFDRLRQRCLAAQARGIYVSIMLFEGHDLQQTQDGWSSHPFRGFNNVNGIEGDLNGNGSGLEIQTLFHPAALAVQEAYVKKVIDTVNDLDNVMFEISNESFMQSIPWQQQMVDFIQAYESTKPQQHPVWITSTLGDSNAALFASNADAVSPWGTAYRDNPPAANGAKIIINDTDHLYGCGGDYAWVWRSFTRGLNVIYMDSYYPDTPFCPGPDELIRLNMGYTRAYATRMNLADALPLSGLASTGYCLAEPGTSYLAWLPGGGSVWMDLSHTGDGEPMNVEWLNPVNGNVHASGFVDGGNWRSLAAPFSGPAVLFVYSYQIASPDINSDGFVDINDLFMVIAGWGECGSCPADLDENGQVDISDLFEVLGEWTLE